jgi:hypothetical protein
MASPGVMVQAPYTGADLREDAFPTGVGAYFGDMIYVDATRPSDAADATVSTFECGRINGCPRDLMTV